jgi:hypothetical protein
MLVRGCLCLTLLMLLYGTFCRTLEAGYPTWPVILTVKAPDTSIRCNLVVAAKQGDAVVFLPQMLQHRPGPKTMSQHITHGI